MSSLRRSSRETYAEPQPSRTRSTNGSTLSISPSAAWAVRPGSITWVMPLARGLEGRSGRSRKSGTGAFGRGRPRGGGSLTAVRAAAARERPRRVALDPDGNPGERARLPLTAQQPEDVDVVVAAGVAVPVAQEALVPEAEAEQRARRAHVGRVRVGAHAVQAEHDERQMGDRRLRLAIRPGTPEPPPEPGADDAAPVSCGELRQPRDPGRAVLAV